MQLMIEESQKSLEHALSSVPITALQGACKDQEKEDSPCPLDAVVSLEAHVRVLMDLWKCVVPQVGFSFFCSSLSLE